MSGNDKSLGDEHTYTGGVQNEPQSLGDEVTFVGGVRDGEAAFDDGMEVVDLAARYTIEGALGKGGMGEVQLATDTRLNRKVAIKRILGDAATSKTAVNRFLTEAQSIAALNHPNIVQIYDYGRATDGPFLIMEYVEGSSLLDKCREGALDLEEAVNLTCQLCDGLSKAHAASIIHRDIKPANILITKDGVPKLTDFGLAKAETSDTGMTMAGAVLGTLDFMPPEQRKDAALVDARSDLWSLAATLYQMVTGEPPRVIDLDEVPGEIRQCIAQALKSKKKDRFQTALEMRDALKASHTESRRPTPVPTEELGAGECPNCHARNESSRKFCSECAASLRVSCLKCETDIPVWDKVCGECGGKQSELVASKLEEFARQREQAEEHRQQYRFEEALSIASSLASMKDERLSEHVPWAQDFVTSIEAEWERERESAMQHFEEAQKHRSVFDYQSAIHSLESILEPMRDVEMRAYLEQLEQDQAEAEELIQTISDAVERRNLTGLLEQVERAVELRGDRDDLKKLAGQLRERETKLIHQRDNAYKKASELLKTGDALGGWNLIQGVKWHKLREKDRKLASRLRTIVTAEKELSDLIKDAKADGILEPHEVVSMWIATRDYLEINPRHKELGQIMAQLEMRIKKAPGEYAEFPEIADFWFIRAHHFESRDELKQILRNIDDSRTIICPNCGAVVIAKNLLRHFDKNH